MSLVSALMSKDIVSPPSPLVDVIAVFARKILASENEAQTIDFLGKEFGSERYFFLKQAYTWAGNPAGITEIPVCASSSYPAVLQMFADLVVFDHRGSDEELEEKKRQISSLGESPPTDGHCLVVGLNHNDCVNSSGFRIYDVGFDTIIGHAKTLKEKLSKRIKTPGPRQLLQYGVPIQF